MANRLLFGEKAMNWKRFIVREWLIILGLISAAFLASEIWYLSSPPSFTKSYDDYLGFCLIIALIIYIGIWFIRSIVWWKRFIVREYLIVLGFIVLGLIIAYICFLGEVLTYSISIEWEAYESKYFGRSIFGFKTESSVPPDMDWYHFLFGFEGIDPGIDLGYQKDKERIEERYRHIREIHHHFFLKKPFVPPDREWVYFFACEDEPGNTLGFSRKYNFGFSSLSKSIMDFSYFEKPGANLRFPLSPQKRDEKNPLKITDVLIHTPRKFYPWYIRYMRKCLIIAYAGFWFFRAGVWGVKRLRVRKKNGA